MSKPMVALLVLLALAASAEAEETESQCANLPADTVITVEPYYQAPYSATDMLCDGASQPHPQTCVLRGMLYRRASANRPAVIVNHGGANPDKHEDSFLCVVRYFLRHDFVVFVPLRRGYTMDGPHTGGVQWSTGKFSGQVTDELAAWIDSDAHPFPREAVPYWPECSQQPASSRTDCVSAKLVRAEVSEIRLAMGWLKAKTMGGATLVDPAKVALVGHSGGSKVSLMAAADLTGADQPQVAVSTSMAERGTWGSNTFLDADLTDCAARSPVPVAYLQPANAESLKSTEKLSEAAAAARRNFVAQVFPPVEDTVTMSAHSGFFELEDEVLKWGPVARLYMAIHGVE